MSVTRLYYDGDPSFIYQGFWFAGLFNATHVGQSGTLHTTNVLTSDTNVTFKFPVAATAFSYWGIKRSHGGNYSICVDCDSDAPNFINVDGFNATDDGQNPPIILYQQTFTTLGMHEVIIYNQPDSRGQPAGNSELTLARFELTVPGSTDSDPSTPPSGVTPPTSISQPAHSFTTSSLSSTFTVRASTSSASTSMPTSISPLSSSIPTSASKTDTTAVLPSSNISPVAVPTTSASSNAPTTNVIVGISIAAVVVLSSISLFLYWLFLRWKRARAAPSNRQVEQVYPGLAGSAWGALRRATPVLDSQTPGARLRSEKSGPSSFNPSSLPASGVFNGSAQSTPNMNVRRERDAGPLSSWIGEIILPPDYAQVFAERPRSASKERI